MSNNKPFVSLFKITESNILAQIAAIVLLLKRTLAFIVRITILFRKLHQSNEPDAKEKLQPPYVPKPIQHLIQLE